MGNSVSGDESGSEGKSPSGNAKTGQRQIKTSTFAEMFVFNAAVMGFTQSAWMNEVLVCFDNIVRNISNANRLAEECDFLVLRISKLPGQTITLSDFKACMLASMRSLLPKYWTPDHEVAWTWLWTNVEKMLTQSLGQPAIYQKALAQLLSSIDELQFFELKKDIYELFFSKAPRGQDYFKQSNTRLQYLLERNIDMTLEIYKEPHRLADDLASIGLRHVAFGIPTELIGPFVSSCVEVMASYSKDETAIDAFRWSLGLMANVMVRTITEGSTIIMTAIDHNSKKTLKKAIAGAPRGKRAEWLLLVEVGSQRISPLMWAIESGNLDAAEAIIEDLLTIRADRERYYFGVDDLVGRHPDIIQRLVLDAPNVLTVLLESLVWRSRFSKHGQRRVNFYVKHLLLDAEGGVSDALQWWVALKDPKIITHPVVVFVSDTLWSGLVRGQFIRSKVWFMFSLFVFMLSQSILPNSSNEEDDTVILHWTIFICRCCNYLLSLGKLAVGHGLRFGQAYHQGDTEKTYFGISIPTYFRDPSEMASIVLMMSLFLMSTHEPMLYCLTDPEWPTLSCGESEEAEFRYALFAMCAMTVHWALLMDLAVFSTTLSAFVLVCKHVLSEIGRFIIALVFLLLTFGSAISVLPTQYEHMSDMQSATVALFSMIVRLYDDDYRGIQEDPALLVAVLLFITASTVLILNLLIAQLNCSYERIYQDMVGFARLNRASVIVEVLGKCPRNRWNKFIEELRLDEPLEFNEGDKGPPGGISFLEPASLHPSVKDSIHRYGGTCSPDEPWPENNDAGEADADRLDRIEKMVLSALHRSTVAARRKHADSISEDTRSTSSKLDADVAVSE